MARSRWSGWVAVLAFALIASNDDGTRAQTGVNMRLTVAANSRERSPGFDLLPSTQLTVRLEQAPVREDGVVRVYVFDQSGVLSAVDDPDVTSDTFVFQPTGPGLFFVVIVNTNSAPVTVQIESVPMRGGQGTAKNAAVVRVLFATNRALVAGEAARFGADPGVDLSYGFCDVSIPRDHRMGELEAPSIWRLQFREDPEKHVVLVSTKSEAASEFYAQIATRVAESASRQALVFVHGFNQTFEDATKRTAQIAYDLAFDGPAIAFTWP